MKARVPERLALAISAVFALLMMMLGGCESLLTKPSLYGTVTVQVARRDSTPIAGSQLILYTGARPMGYAATGANGEYIFKNVPEGVYGVRAIPPDGYRTLASLSGGDQTEVHDQLLVNDSAHIALSFRFLRVGAGSIAVHVAQENGSPIVGLPLLLYDDTRTLLSAVTDVGGNYVFTNVPFGSYGVSATRLEKYQDGTQPATEAEDGIVTDAGSTQKVELNFEPCTGDVTVSIRDDFGDAVKGSTLTFYDNLHVITQVKVDTSADYTFADVPCGIYGVRVQPPVGYTVVEGPGTSYRDQLSVHRHSELAAQLTLTRTPRATIHVSVVDDIGTKLNNVRIVLYTGAGVTSDVLSDATGSATFANIPITQQYGVRVVPRAGYTVREAPGSSYFDGIALTNGAVREIVFVLKRD